MKRLSNAEIDARINLVIVDEVEEAMRLLALDSRKNKGRRGQKTKPWDRR